MALAVSDYMLGREIQSKEYVTPVQSGETDIVDNYSLIDSQHQVGEPDDQVDETPAEDPVLSFPKAMNIVQDPSPASAAELVGESRKHTYAAIVLSSPLSSYYFYIICLG